MTLTPRLKIPRQAGGDPAKLPAALNAAVDQIDAVAAKDGQGPLSAVLPPAADLIGTYYRALDAKALLRCDGTKWDVVAADPLVGSIVSDQAYTNAPAAKTKANSSGGVAHVVVPATGTYRLRAYTRTWRINGPGNVWISRSVADSSTSISTTPTSDVPTLLPILSPGPTVFLNAGDQVWFYVQVPAGPPNPQLWLGGGSWFELTPTALQLPG